VLARWARAHLREHLGGPPAERPVAVWCNEPAATFVTLRWPAGQLQGCIGCLLPTRTIVDDVASNTISAALHDPRSEPIELADVDHLELEISLLSPLEPVAVAAIRPGVDGLVLEYGGRRGTLLPAMWKQLPEPAAFLAALVQKAGLPRDVPLAELRLSRYTTDHYVDRAPARRS
jgi:AmmeMemoRadiSam system protein A